MKIGIIQGRLSPPVEGFQETPKNWQKEFEYLKQLNMIDHGLKNSVLYKLRVLMTKKYEKN